MKKANSILLTMLLSIAAIMSNSIVNAQFHYTTDIVEAGSSSSIYELREKDGYLYYVTTTSQSIFTNDESCITKVNISTGDTLQKICFEADGFISMNVDSDENIIISFRPEVDFDYDPSDATEATASCDGFGCVALLKYDSNSNLIFSKFFSNDLGFSLNDIVTDTDNNIYITGQERTSRIDFDPSATSANITSYGERDCFLIKYGADGSFKWLNTFGGEENDYAYSLTISEENELTVLGGYYSGSLAYSETDALPNTNPETTRNLFILRSDSAGDILSAQYLIAVGDPLVLDAHLADDGTLTFVGSTDGFLFYVSTDGESQELISQNNEGYIIQLDSEGNLVNSLTTDNFYFSTLDTDTEGNIYANGVFGFNGEIDVDPSDAAVNYTTNGLSDHVWVKYSSEFTYLNSGHFGGSRQAFSVGNGIVVLAEDDFFLAGKVGGTTQSEIIVDFDPLPDSEFELQITTLNGALFLTRYTPEQITGIQNGLDQNYSIYPNPSSGDLNFEVESTVERIEIRNAQGAIIQSSVLSSETLKIEDLNQGIYFISGFNQQGELTFTEKVLIQK